MKKLLYYHIYLTDDYATWAYPFMEQFKLMEDSGLLSTFDSVNITCISQNDNVRIKTFIDLCASFRDMNITIHINSHNNDDSMLKGINADKTLTENVMMCKIWNDSHDVDAKVLYLHSKGITSVDNHLARGNVDVFKNYYYWRQFLNWGVIENWKRCVNDLDVYDTVGVNYFNEPSRHYSGNFWWANMSYIRSLPDPSTLEWWNQLRGKTSDSWLRNAPNRFRDEMWLCSNDTGKFSSIKDLEQVTNLSVKLIMRNEYEKK